MRVRMTIVPKRTSGAISGRRPIRRGDIPARKIEALRLAILTRAKERLNKEEWKIFLSLLPDSDQEIREDMQVRGADTNLVGYINKLVEKG